MDALSQKPEVRDNTLYLNRPLTLEELQIKTKPEFGNQKRQNRKEKKIEENKLFEYDEIFDEDDGAIFELTEDLRYISYVT